MGKMEGGRKKSVLRRNPVPSWEKSWVLEGKIDLRERKRGRSETKNSIE